MRRIVVFANTTNEHFHFSPLFFYHRKTPPPPLLLLLPQTLHSNARMFIYLFTCQSIKPPPPPPPPTLTTWTTSLHWLYKRRTKPAGTHSFVAPFIIQIYRMTSVSHSEVTTSGRHNKAPPSLYHQFDYNYYFYNFINRSIFLLQQSLYLHCPCPWLSITRVTRCTTPSLSCLSVCRGQSSGDDDLMTIWWWC